MIFTGWDTPLALVKADLFFRRKLTTGFTADLFDPFGGV